MIVGGGVVAGAGGMLFFYIAIKGGAPLSRVMPIAFTSPLFGAFMAFIYGGEPLTLKTFLE